MVYVLFVHNFGYKMLFWPCWLHILFSFKDNHFFTELICKPFMFSFKLDHEAAIPARLTNADFVHVLPKSSFTSSFYFERYI